MFDQFLLMINEWMMGGFGLAVVGCFLWGLVSVLFSPCHLASIPLMVGYVAGQGTLVQGRQAAGYAVLFSAGLFVSIAFVGIICSMLGRMLGDISPLWGIPVGGLFIWLGLNLIGIKACKLPSGSLGNLKMRGYGGALILGLSYGILSGACTFGFIAPILAIITVQEEVAKGLSLILFFALGHCLPIVVAGSSAALAQRVLAGRGMQTATVWGRRIAGGLVAAIGVYFIVSAFTSL
ncbi:cytochrome C biosynthesis protein [Desulfovibrio sp. OttesenSCG-928-G11]|nr:cytochrome C biosynthesis protein [Desulfovibrio sp. OttesenSCG-928-G11]